MNMSTVQNKELFSRTCVKMLRAYNRGFRLRVKFWPCWLFLSGVWGGFKGSGGSGALSGHLHGEAGEPTPLSGCVWQGLCSGRGRGIGTGRATGGGGSKKEPGSLF